MFQSILDYSNLANLYHEKSVQKMFKRSLLRFALLVGIGCLVALNGFLLHTEITREHSKCSIWKHFAKDAEKLSFASIRCPNVTNEMQPYVKAIKDEDVFTCDNNGETIVIDDVLVAGKRRKERAFLSIGLPTIERLFENKTASYLTTTLTQLIEHTHPDDQGKVVFIVYLADELESKRNKVLKQVQTNFPEYLENGVVQVIKAVERYYPQLRNLPGTLGDGQTRMYWRSKQSADYVYLMRYAKDVADYYMQMEDDVSCEVNYTKYIRDFMHEKENDPWVSLSFTGWGFIGKLFRRSEIMSFSNYLATLYNESPCDWLYYNYLDMKGRPEGYEMTRTPPIFHHIGHQSSSWGTS